MLPIKGQIVECGVLTNPEHFLLYTATFIATIGVN